MMPGSYCGRRIQLFEITALLAVDLGLPSRNQASGIESQSAKGKSRSAVAASLRLEFKASRRFSVPLCTMSLRGGYEA